MRLISSSVFLFVTAAGLCAQSSSSSETSEEHCTVRFGGQRCDGLGCVNQAAVRYGNATAREEIVELGYPSSSDNNHFGSPEAVTAKALLQLGKQGWELESVSPDSKTYPNSREAVYYLKRRTHGVPKE